MTHLSLHVASLSPVTVWEIPLWSWRQYVRWQDSHLEQHKKAGVKRCERC